MTRVDFTQLQLPVGQGGFHVGRLKVSETSEYVGCLRENPDFLWVYDCGSDQNSSLKREIGKFRDVHVNMLFLSHLDDDHVSGIDTLLHTASHVHEVVLPYLGDIDWVLHLAAGAASDSLSGNFIDMAADPASWFGNRGVNRITYIGAGEEDEGTPGRPDPIEPSEPDPDRIRKLVESEDYLATAIKSDWTRSPEVAAIGNEVEKRAQISIASRGSVASFHTAGETLNWLLSPFTFRPSVTKISAFQVMLDTEFGPGLTVNNYADEARTTAGRKKLRACYDAVWKTHNLHSMALYAGPGIPTMKKLSNTARQGNFIRRVVQPGWVSTGDFNLRVKKRRNQLIGYYSPYSEMVGQLTLSHHGSDHSFHPTALSAFPDLTFAIASVGANTYGHPGLGVQKAVNSEPGIAFVRVDENESSFLTVSGPVGRLGQGP